MSEKIAPVQGWPDGIPWDMHLRAYEVYCKRWGKQQALVDLEGHNCRGGFSTGELDEFIPGWRDEVSTIGKLRKELTTRDLTIAELRARVKEFEQNVKRYQWIRSHLDDDEDYHLMEHKKGCDYGLKQFNNLDRAIDAAIAKEGK